MGRTHNHTHMLQTVLPGYVYHDGKVGSPEQLAVCGEKPWRACATERSKVTCPACCAKLAKKDLKTLWIGLLSFGEPIRDKEILGYDLRSVWPLWYKDKLMGFATMKTGWGNGWDICPVEPGRAGMVGGSRLGYSKTYHSKEDALLAVPQLVEDGKLFSPENAAEAHKREAAEREAKWLAEQAESDRRYRVLCSIAPLCSPEQLAELELACKARFYRGLPKVRAEEAA